MGQQAGRAPVVRGQAGPLLVLAPGPGLLLAAGGSGLVQGIDGSGVRLSKVRVGVGRLRVSQLLVGRRKVGGRLVFGDSRMGEGRRGAVEMLPCGGEVRQARVPIAARVVAILGQRNRDPVRTKPRSCELSAAAAPGLLRPGTHCSRPARPRGALPSSQKASGGATCPGGGSLSTASLQKENWRKDLGEGASGARRRRSGRSVARGNRGLPDRIPGLGAGEAEARILGEGLHAAQSAIAHKSAHARVVRKSGEEARADNARRAGNALFPRPRYPPFHALRTKTSGRETLPSRAGRPAPPQGFRMEPAGARRALPGYRYETTEK